MTTVADKYGPDVADALARWAIDALCEPPVERNSRHTRGALLSWRTVTKGRGILNAAGIDWEALKNSTGTGHRVHR